MSDDVRLRLTIPRSLRWSALEVRLTEDRVAFNGEAFSALCTASDIPFDDVMSGEICIFVLLCAWYRHALASGEASDTVFETLEGGWDCDDPRPDTLHLRPVETVQ